MAVLFTGKIGQFFINLLCCLVFWLPGIIHAVYVVMKADADKRHKELLAATRGR